ncbi:hypothetical protein [Lacinutrix jangbogonensis]|uniref:hypothetical protein n=1 Tax=Lacinutrix jangbogonensis TaxID=1469557 RepID=UPI00138E06C1
MQHIISHEKAHATQLHSIDVIIAQLATIFFWFNPFTWLYKKNYNRTWSLLQIKKHNVK